MAVVNAQSVFLFLWYAAWACFAGWFVRARLAEL